MSASDGKERNVHATSLEGHQKKGTAAIATKCEEGRYIVLAQGINDELWVWPRRKVKEDNNLFINLAAPKEWKYEVVVHPFPSLTIPMYEERNLWVQSSPH